MTPTRVGIRAIVVDCRDPERLAAFWSQVMGKPVSGRLGPHVLLEGGTDPGLVFQRVEAVTPGKDRIHLDLSAPDPAAEQRRIEELGGRRLPEYDEGGFLVMADPEDNEFCILPDGPFDIDDQGRAHYLDG